MDAEKKLWQSVLLVAVNDALTIKKPQNTIYKNKIIDDAKEWLLNNKTYYYRVCSMADIDPINLREKVKAVFAQQDQTILDYQTDIIGKLIEEVNLTEVYDK